MIAQLGILPDTAGDLMAEGMLRLDKMKDGSFAELAETSEVMFAR